MPSSDPPTVSVLMTVYNGGHHVASAVESVLAQSFRDLELLVIDDGSDDGTTPLLEAFAARDPRVRILRNPGNRGRSFSAHRGVDEARGHLVARLDADDWAFPHRLESQVRFLRDRPDVDIVGSWAIEIDEDGVERALRRVPTESSAVRRLIWANPIINSSVMFRRQRVLDVGSYDATLPYLEDYDLWFRCADAGLVMANIPEPLIRYRVSMAQHRKRRSPKWQRAQIRVGWGGCMRLRLGPMAFLGVTAPLVKAMFPERYGMAVQKIFRKFDPRDRVGRR